MHGSEVVLVRHGETLWSRSGKHTGRTDLPLTETGRCQSERVGDTLRGRRFALVLASPLQRAAETCRLASLGDSAVLREELMEWDYGAYEGRTTAEIQRERWLDLPPTEGRLFALDPSTISTLGYERATPVIRGWNE